jgi:acetyl esterase/lipase
MNSRIFTACLGIFLLAAPVGAAMGQALTPAPSQIISLDGKPMADANPLDKDRVAQFNTPEILLYPCKDAAPKGTVMLCPGGGYNWLDMQKEGAVTAQYMNAVGFDVAILEYHTISSPETRDIMPKSEASKKSWDLALADALPAYRMLKANAASLGLHPGRFAIMGYSAGGHLCARLVQNLADNEQPDDVILAYPAFLNLQVPGTQTYIITPPKKPGRLFVIMGDKDLPAWLQGAQAFAKAWQDAGGKSTFVLLPGIGHGFGSTKLDPLRTYLANPNP